MRWVVGLSTALVVLLSALPSTATAAFIHPEVKHEFGSGGTAATTIPGLDSLSYNQANKRLYALSTPEPRQIFGFHFNSAGSFSPLGGAFPFTVPGGGGVPQIDVDNTASGTANNIYYAVDGESLLGYQATGAPLAATFSPAAGETCGVAVDKNGNVWSGNYVAQRIEEFPPTGGAPIATVDTSAQGSPCHLIFDRATNDLYVSMYGSGAWRYTAASGYSPSSATEYDPRGNTMLAINAQRHVLYAAAGTTVAAYDTASGSKLEEFTPPTGELRGIAVDDASDTVFTSNSATEKVQEWPGVLVPDATTGESKGNDEVTGTVGLAGGGNVTECYFEFGTETGVYTQKQNCEPPAPYTTGPQSVSAHLAGLIGETTYHYRLVAANANGRDVGADGTITPHYVTGLSTGAADEIKRDSALLHASFEGNGEATSYYFEYGLTDSPYSNKTATESAGSPTGPIQVSAAVAGLTAGMTYHYRVVATNGLGTSRAQDRTFVTEEAIKGIATQPATEIGPTGATLHGTLDPDGFRTTYYFEYGKTAGYGQKVPIPAALVPTEAPGATSVSTAVTELSPATVYHFRIVASNSTGQSVGLDQTFTTPQPPSIISVSSTRVTAGSAELVGKINPNGAATTYYFEYGTTTAYGSRAPVPPGALGAGTSVEDVAVGLTGLEGVTYHFRLVAESAFGTAVSEDQTFNFYPEGCPNAAVRQQTGANALPDCRAYELATPELAGNTLIFPATVPFSPTATNPSRIAFTGAFGSVAGTGPAANNIGDLYVATRGTEGWHTKYIGLPASQAAQTSGPPWQWGRGPVASQVSGFAEADRINYNVLTNQSMSKILDWNGGYYACNDSYCQIVGSGPPRGSSYAPYLWDSTSGALLDHWPTGVEGVPGGEGFIGKTTASPDLSHFVFTSNVPFLSGATPGTAREYEPLPSSVEPTPPPLIPGTPTGTLYDDNTSTGAIAAINFSESGEPIESEAVKLSTDGSRILMIAEGTCESGFSSSYGECGVGGQCGGSAEVVCGPGHLYMRVDDDRTYDIAQGHSVRFVSMTANGSKVYFTSEESLTGADTDTSTDLYLWNEAEPQAVTLVSKGNQAGTGNSDSCGASWTEKCDVVPIFFASNTVIEEYSAAQAGVGGNPRAESNTAAVNGDIYFLSPEELAGSNGVQGQENLYVYREGRLQFITALEAGSVACVLDQGSSICSRLAVARMEVSPDGSHMAFLTASRVTSYDNAGHSEIYLYTPATHELVCTSCLPNGQPPTFDTIGSTNGLFMTNDGRTFFDTREALVPQDTNQSPDVYEYVSGRPRLISDGTEPVNEVFGLTNILAGPSLVGVSGDGTDAYFATYSTLVGQDRNGQQLKIYDARTGGGFPFSNPAPGCAAADECHGPLTSAPPPPTSGTGAALTGGNAHKHKHKHKHKKHKKRRHQRHGKKRSHRKSSGDAGHRRHRHG